MAVDCKPTSVCTCVTEKHVGSHGIATVEALTPPCTVITICLHSACAHACIGGACTALHCIVLYHV